MASITVQRHSNIYESNLGTYRLTLEVTASQDIKPQIFVNQRLQDVLKQTFDDVFVAVATPAQLEDFGVNAPNEGSSYFLTSKIDVVARNGDYLLSVVNDIMSYIQQLIASFNALTTLNNDGTYVITGSSTTVS